MGYRLYQGSFLEGMDKYRLGYRLSGWVVSYDRFGYRLGQRLDLGSFLVKIDVDNWT